MDGFFQETGEKSFKELFQTPRRFKKDEKHVCPFAFEGVTHPCLTHAEGRVRKDAISSHLKDVQRGDKPDNGTHDPNNPIWQTWIVKSFYLVKRVKQDPETKKRKLKAYNETYYKKRVAIQRASLPDWSAQLAAGQLTKTEYKAKLIGKERRKIVAEEEFEGRVRARLSEVRQELGAAVGTAEEGSTSQNLLAELEGLVRELKDAKDVCTRSRKHLISYSKGLVSYWNADRQHANFRRAEDGELWEYDRVEMARGWTWPTEASVSAFYTIAAFLTPVDDDTHTQIYSESQMRYMRGRLHEYLCSQQKFYEGHAAWDSLEAVFNESIRLIKEEENRHTSTGECVRWYEEQKPLWAAALSAARSVYMPTFAGKTPLDVIWDVDQAGIYLEAQQE